MLDNIAVVTITTLLYRLVTIDKTFSEPNECKCNNELCASSPLIKGKRDTYYARKPPDNWLVTKLKNWQREKIRKDLVSPGTGLPKHHSESSR